jgi:hypothetical protein
VYLFFKNPLNSGSINPQGVYKQLLKQVVMKSLINSLIKPLLILGLVVITTNSCITIFDKKCGDNIHLGDFLLMPESKEDWFPYLNMDELTFSNSAGKTITLKNTVLEEKMMYHPLGDICTGGWGDSAEEYFMGEWLLYGYSGSFDGISYKIEIILNVESDKRVHTPGRAVSSILYD